MFGIFKKDDNESYDSKWTPEKFGKLSIDEKLDALWDSGGSDENEVIAVIGDAYGTFEYKGSTEINGELYIRLKGQLLPYDENFESRYEVPMHSVVGIGHIDDFVTTKSINENVDEHVDEFLLFMNELGIDDKSLTEAIISGYHITVAKNIVKY